MRRIIFSLGLVILSGCVSTGIDLRRSRGDTFTSSASTRTGAVIGEDRLDVDYNFLKSFTAELSVVAEEARVLQRSLSSRGDLGLLDDDLGKVEYVLFRHLTTRAGLWEIAEHYSNAGHLFAGKQNRLKGQLIGLQAAMQLSYYDTLFVLTFWDDLNIQAALNRAYPDSRIEAGSYNAIRATATNPDNLGARDAAWHYFKSDQDVKKTAEKDAAIRSLADDIRHFNEYSEIATKRLLDKQGIIFPTFENRIKHSMAAGVLKATADAGKAGIGAVGQLTMLAVQPLVKNPFIHGADFSDEQRDLIITLIKPGDIILTYSPGYLSSLFFPGVFIHGITYVGTEEQRQVIGIERRWRYSKKNDNLIEAVGPGVTFNDLKHITEKSVGKMAILRPNISAESRQAFLQGVFDYLGRPYDFRFDFMDPLRLCCTEVIYHCLNGKGGINFPMKKRLGMPTLSADDILNYYLKEPGAQFDLVLLAEKDPKKSGNEGVIHVGPAATDRLRAILE